MPAQSDYSIEKQLDLAGEVCPFTFVRSKLALEQLASGEVLKVLVDNSESASNVPRSLELEGHDVIAVEKAPSGWHIIVRKA